MDGDLAIDCFAWVVHSSDAKISIVSLLNYSLTSELLLHSCLTLPRQIQVKLTP